MAVKEEHVTMLGMPVATATARLKKAMMFEMAVALERDNCLRCDKPIETAEELSVDHIQPWRYESAELFWDLTNVAFSHRACNKVDRPRRREGPEGTSWCCTHKAFLSEDAFGADINRWNGLSITCLQCDRERAARYAARNPRFACPECKTQMRKVCPSCGYELPMKDYMALRRKEGVKY